MEYPSYRDLLETIKLLLADPDEQPDDAEKRAKCVVRLAEKKLQEQVKRYGWHAEKQNNANSASRKTKRTGDSNG